MTSVRISSLRHRPHFPPPKQVSYTSNTTTLGSFLREFAATRIRLTLILPKRFGLYCCAVCIQTNFERVAIGSASHCSQAANSSELSSLEIGSVANPFGPRISICSKHSVTRPPPASSTFKCLKSCCRQSRLKRSRPCPPFLFTI